MSFTEEYNDLIEQYMTRRREILASVDVSAHDGILDGEPAELRELQRNMAGEIKRLQEKYDVKSTE